MQPDGKIKSIFSKRWVKAVAVIIAVLIVVDVIQLVFPHDMALPFRKIDGVAVGGLYQTEITDKLNNIYTNQQLTIANDQDQTIMKPLGDYGISVNVDHQVTQVLDYPLWQRFIPLSFLWDLIQPPAIASPPVKLSDSAGLQCSSPVDAKIEVKDGQLAVQPAEKGCSFDNDVLNQSLLNLQLRAGSDPILHFNIQITEPNITTKTADDLAAKIGSNILNGVDFNANGTTTHAGYADVVNMLEFTNNADTKSIVVSINQDKLQNFIENSPLVGQMLTARNIVIYTTNGVETGRDPGQAGKSANYNQLSIDLHDAVTNKIHAVNVEIIDVTPQITYKRSYSSDWTGLTAQLNDQYAGSSYAIVVLDLMGGNQNLFINADYQFTAASTYKLFTAYSMFKTGNPPACLDIMIINSDNNCPESFLTTYGLRTSQDDARSIGAASTSFAPSNMVTTARDLATILIQIHNGSILSPTDNNRLLNDMKSQVYRSGIPAGVGSRGVVADKVGFLWGLLHDAAIVYTDHGDYIMVIMTNGYSWSSIANTAQLISQYM